MSRLNNEYIALLSADDKIASDKFRELEKRIKNDKERFVVMDIEDYEREKAGTNCVNAA